MLFKTNISILVYPEKLEYSFLLLFLFPIGPKVRILFASVKWILLPRAGRTNPFYDPSVEKKSCVTREKH